MSVPAADAKAAERTAVEGEYKPKLDEVTGKLTIAEKAAAERAGQQRA